MYEKIIGNYLLSQIMQLRKYSPLDPRHFDKMSEEFVIGDLVCCQNLC
jgi:hypothetical protein